MIAQIAKMPIKAFLLESLGFLLFVVTSGKRKKKEGAIQVARSTATS